MLVLQKHCSKIMMLIWDILDKNYDPCAISHTFHNVDNIGHMKCFV